MMLYAFGSLIVAIPTALWLVAFGGLVVAYVRQRSGGGAADFAVPALILSLLALPLPIVAALAGFPFGHRYFNISIGLFVAALLLCSFGLAPLLRRPLATALAVAALTGLLLAETAPFRPLFAAFRPIWLNYGDAFAPEAGRINASWMSWGEDTMLAGKLLAAKCRVGDAEIAGLRCDEIVLHTTGSGLWLPARGPIAVATVDPGLIAEKRSDFYVFNRLFLIQNLYPTPTISPSYKVSLRGYDLAWIYRADRLAASGYRFTN
jgi:hypothetical protein